VSDGACRSGTDGADGAIASIVTLIPVESPLTLPAPSVAVAVMMWSPWLSADVMATL
jgi:hypothetical protein